MRILTEDDLPICDGTAMAIGLFDGVHIGHIELIKDITKKLNLSSVLYTFDKKPNSDLQIFTSNEKISIIKNLSVNNYFANTFDKNFQNINPKDFIKMIVNNFCVKHITVGFDFKFGKNAKGDIELLKTLQPLYNYSLSIIPQISIDGYKVSSSNIRNQLKNGNMEMVTNQIGRLYFIDGEVVKGNNLGSKIGFPTANIYTSKLLPNFGVYTTIVKIYEDLFPAVTNIGVKPSIQMISSPVIETHILNFNENLYGKKIRVYFVKRLRPEIKFNKLEDLKLQILNDVEKAKTVIDNLKVYKSLLI